MLPTIILLIALSLAYGVKTTVSGLIVLGVHMHLVKTHFYSRLAHGAMSRYETFMKGIKNMVTRTTNQNTDKTLTLTGEELHNPALMLAAMLRQGIRVNADSPISALGGGRYNPALIIYQTVKHMDTATQIETLVKRESVLSDYYQVLRNDDVKKELINERVDNARQVFIETGKHSAKVMAAIKGIASEQTDESERETRRQVKRGNSAPTESAASVDSVYTVNDSPKLMIKVTKLLASNDIRVSMVSGDVLPQGSTVVLGGVATRYTVRSIQGKTMTLTSKTLAERVKEESVSVAASAKTSGRVAGMGSTKASATPAVLSKADVLKRVMAMLDSIDE